MAQLIQIRQRIKAIETIKKITHAMRLISMSAHTRLKGQQQPLQKYQQAIAQLFSTIKNEYPQWHNPIFNPQSDTGKTLVILIGSQKGLCGNFNNALFYFFDEDLQQLRSNKSVFISVGKKANEHLIKKGVEPYIHYKNLTTSTLDSIARAIINLITNGPQQYTSVIIYSNKLKTFFVQKPNKMALIPFSAEHVIEQAQPSEDYHFELPINSVINYVAEQLLVANLEHLLFESLLAEQAARFISMDAATRNANTLLDQTKLTYNKIRQFNITKELSELTGTF